MSFYDRVLVSKWQNFSLERKYNKVWGFSQFCRILFFKFLLTANIDLPQKWRWAKQNDWSKRERRRKKSQHSCSVRIWMLRQNIYFLAFFMVETRRDFKTKRGGNDETFRWGKIKAYCGGKITERKKGQGTTGVNHFMLLSYIIQSLVLPALYIVQLILHHLLPVDTVLPYQCTVISCTVPYKAEWILYIYICFFFIRK